MQPPRQQRAWRGSLQQHFRATGPTQHVLSLCSLGPRCRLASSLAQLSSSSFSSRCSSSSSSSSSHRSGLHRSPHGCMRGHQQLLTQSSKMRQHAPQGPHRAAETASKAPAFMAQAPGHAAAACLAPQAPITPCIPRAAQHKPAKAGPSKQTPKAAAANALAPGGFSSTAAAAHSKAAKAPDAAPRKRKAPEELDAAEVCPCKAGPAPCMRAAADNAGI